MGSLQSKSPLAPHLVFAYIVLGSERLILFYYIYVERFFYQCMVFWSILRVYLVDLCCFVCVGYIFFKLNVYIYIPANFPPFPICKASWIAFTSPLRSSFVCLCFFMITPTCQPCSHINVSGGDLPGKNHFLRASSRRDVSRRRYG